MNLFAFFFTPVTALLGALGAAKPERLCAPSQNGLMPDLPQRHRAIVRRPGSMSTPSWSTRRKPPAHRRSKGDSVPFHPLAKVAAADTARQIPAVNGHHH